MTNVNELADLAGALGAELQAQELADSLKLRSLPARERTINRDASALAAVLKPPQGISSGLEALEWFRTAMERVLEAAEVIPHDPRNRAGHQGDRALCPLCGTGARGNINPLEPGYALDEGLWYHLMGERNSPMCEIAAGVLEQAHRCWKVPVA